MIRGTDPSGGQTRESNTNKHKGESRGRRIHPRMVSLIGRGGTSPGWGSPELGADQGPPKKGHEQVSSIGHCCGTLATAAETGRPEYHQGEGSLGG